MKSLFLFLVLMVTSYDTSAHPLAKMLDALEEQYGGSFGLSILDVETQKQFSINGDMRFPMMSTFKSLACAKLLHDAENGKQSLKATHLIQKQDIVTYSPVMKKKVGDEIALIDACAVTMKTSDNAAANIVLSETGGPADLTSFMRAMGDKITRLDRYETELNSAIAGDERDTSTPNAMTKAYYQLLYGDVLSEASESQLTDWLKSNEVGGSLLRSVLPNGWSIGDRTGAGENGSRGIVAVVWPQDRSPFIVAIYMTQTSASFKERNQAIADIGRVIFISR
ncbi:class A beta-lactamase [Alteromonadaceae bacterium M269]|nr:class A beta-lactamase [Alteromonadaceae bacterium M269]